MSEGESPREVIDQCIDAWVFDSVEMPDDQADAILAALSDAGYEVAKLERVGDADAGALGYTIPGKVLAWVRDPEGTETP